MSSWRKFGAVCLAQVTGAQLGSVYIFGFSQGWIMLHFFAPLVFEMNRAIEDPVLEYQLVLSISAFSGLLLAICVGAIFESSYFLTRLIPRSTLFWARTAVIFPLLCIFGSILVVGMALQGEPVSSWMSGWIMMVGFAFVGIEWSLTKQPKALFAGLLLVGALRLPSVMSPADIEIYFPLVVAAPTLLAFILAWVSAIRSDWWPREAHLFGPS